VAQLTVYKNKNPRSKATFPFLVDVQAELLDELDTRVVIPMTRAAALTKNPVSQLTPVLEFEGESYVLMTPQLAGIARNELGPVSGNLAGHREVVLAAVDFLLTGF
jgi:toxin CcdB